MGHQHPKQAGIGDRMKEYEHAFDQRCMPLLPVCARLDGRAFHGFCRELEKPFDGRLTTIMHKVTMHLMEEARPVVGYTQSDEITLIFYAEEYGSQVFFDGRIPKLTSVLASMASVYFNALLPEWLPEKAGRRPVFDCRVWQVPNLAEAANVLVWRELDASRNSIESLARAHFSHRELHEKNQKDMHEMLHTKGVNWNDLPDYLKRGRYFGWSYVNREGVPRPAVAPLELPPLARVPNKVGVIFRGEQPESAPKGPSEKQ